MFHKNKEEIACKNQSHSTASKESSFLLILIKYSKIGEIFHTKILMDDKESERVGAIPGLLLHITR
jgi:hypothetical protein